MSKSRVMLLLTAGALVGGCQVGTQPLNTTSQDADFDAILEVFNDDLGVEGSAVSRSEVEDAFADDPELLETVLSDLAAL